MKFNLLFAIAGVLIAARLKAADVPTVTAGAGWVIFDPTRDGYAYRYGPSFIVSANGTIDVFFASPGGAGSDGAHQWDWIRHRSSEDGGHKWSPETVVLKATPGSRDRQSVCDPGVILLNGWYYLGVTSVEDPR